MGKKSEYTVTIEKGNKGSVYNLKTTINGVAINDFSAKVPYPITYKKGDVIRFDYFCPVYKGRLTVDGVSHDSGYQFVATGKHNIVFLGTDADCP